MKESRRVGREMLLQDGDSRDNEGRVGPRG